ncbi:MULTISPECIES: hypothetical protein [Desulfofundulus]|jgi:hypothetical protein|uniref:Uncharacterized protein n=2 Tax=Desulfofundulus TaxID=2282741 RepID=A0AAU8PEV6_DESK7|nr:MULTISPECIES: hypothetical protein [Desulfofundulus]AEG15935.1 hypothetical protein Desku_2401 [Desulfofundulus kuznetsovii DSM 6115]MBE3586270.1 hypothetical protein [Thermoanaerobacter sp.]MCS5695791.1 hypothetical protein [Desulfofundulus thermocisternus]MDQ0286357.1 hypothetical protein [Desulfofundulus luciae]
MSKLPGKVLINDVEYIVEEGLGHMKLRRRDPVSGMKVENVFIPVPDSRERMVNFKAKAAQLILEEITK